MTDEPTTNPPIYEGTPEDGDIVQYRASDNSWQLVTIADAGAITVPQAAPSEVTASSAALATTAPTQTTPWGFSTQAQGQAIITQGNANRTDIAALIVELDALQTKLTTAGILD